VVQVLVTVNCGDSNLSIGPVYWLHVTVPYGLHPLLLGDAARLRILTTGRAAVNGVAACRPLQVCR
jgi:hypothetical protein